MLTSRYTEKTRGYEIHYFAGGLIHFLAEWITNGLEESDEEMAAMIQSFAKL